MNKDLIKIAAAKLSIPPKLYYGVYSSFKKGINKFEHKRKKAADIRLELDSFNVKNLSILLDSEDNAGEMLDIAKAYNIKIYTMNMYLVGAEIEGFKVSLLIKDNVIQEDVDGWLVCSVSNLYAYSLGQFLLDNGLEKQIIFNYLTHSKQTKYYSNVDFFGGSQKTNVHINNYYGRLYNIYYPLPLRITVRKSSGEIVKRFQIIIPKDAVKILSSDGLVSDGFVGYMEVEYEINSKVMPFLHYMVDYISESAICTNHQAGLGLVSPNQTFTRGFLPEEKDRTLIASFFQKNHASSVDVKATLRYSEDGIKKIDEKCISNLAQHEMHYQDIKELFNEVDFSLVKNARVTFECDYPLHRPNFYYKKYGEDGYYDTSHSAAPMIFHNRGGNLHTTEEINGIKKAGCTPFDMRLLLFPEKYKLDTYLATGDEVSNGLHDLNLFVFSEFGEVIDVGLIDCNFDDSGWVNISEYIRSKVGRDVVGTVSLGIPDDGRPVPIFANGIGAYKHKESGHVTSTVCDASTIKNIPFYYRGSFGGGLLLEDTAQSVTDVFTRAVSDDDYDTLFAIPYDSSSMVSSSIRCVTVEIITSAGKKNSLYFDVKENGALYLELSELLGQCTYLSVDGCYTVWFECKGVTLNILSLLVRKNDSVCSIEHTYVGKYGM